MSNLLKTLVGSLKRITLYPPLTFLILYGITNEQNYLFVNNFFVLQFAHLTNYPVSFPEVVATHIRNKVISNIFSVISDHLTF